MSLTFPDNPKRQDRLIELGVQAQDYLGAALKDYDIFKKDIAAGNAQIAQAFRNAKVKAPTVQRYDILKLAGVADQTKLDDVVEISELVTGVASVVATFKYLGPASLKYMLREGYMTAAAAEKPLFSICGFTRTVGDVTGDIAGGMLAGVLNVGIDLGLDAIQGAIVKNKMEDAIPKVFSMRATIYETRLKTSILAEMAGSVVAAVDALTDPSIGLDPTPAQVKKVVQADVAKVMKKVDAIDASSVAAELAKQDKLRNSYTDDDVKS